MMVIHLVGGIKLPLFWFGVLKSTTLNLGYRSLILVIEGKKCKVSCEMTIRTLFKISWTLDLELEHRFCLEWIYQEILLLMRMIRN